LSRIAAVLAAWGPLGAFFLAMVDSAGIPLPAGVDALLILTASTNPGAGYLAALCASIGSLIGAFVLFWIGRKGGQMVLARHTTTPRAQRFRRWFSHYGLVTVFVPKAVPLIPLPTKVFVLSAGAFGTAPLQFGVVVMAARLLRYFGIVFLASRLGDDTLPWLRSHVWLLVGVALALSAAIMVLMYLAGREEAPAE
jgi:membrane protein YqaA with SNARE-associated domain